MAFPEKANPRRQKADWDNQGVGVGGVESDTLTGTGCFSGGMEKLSSHRGVVVHDSVGALNATEVYLSNWLCPFQFHEECRGHKTPGYGIRWAAVE